MIETSADRQYADLLAACLRGEVVQTRNSECLRSIFLSASFDRTPLVGLRRTAWKTALREMEWFLSGSDCVHDLHPSVRPWWQPWADAEGRVRNNYGAQLRAFHGRGGRAVDQVQYLIDSLREHPGSRRAVATTWNTADMLAEETPITNCHGSLITAHVEAGNRVTLVMVQRSADAVVGLPANWVQYWALMLWLSFRAGRQPGRLLWLSTDVHVYRRHEDLARRLVNLWLEAAPTPDLVYTPTSEQFLADDFALDGPYTPMVNERAEMVV